ICRLFGRECVYCTDFSDFERKDPAILRKQAEAYRDAKSKKEQDALFEANGIRWSELWRLPYWDPTRMLVVDSMHAILEGLVHYHCRHVLRLDMEYAKAKENVEMNPAFSYNWPPYDYNYNKLLGDLPQKFKVEEEDELKITQICELLQMPFECENQTSLNAETLSKKFKPIRVAALRYVCHLLNLPKTVTINKAGKNETVKAQYKSHFIDLLIAWRRTMPSLSNGSHPSTPRIINKETIQYIQQVIRETSTPAWVNHVPHSYGESNAGTIKADEWRTLSTIYIPIALISLWGEKEGQSPLEGSYLLQVLDHTMALFQAT
ncbi:hypothetical protein F5051DRAFT_296924, partial [Lentinula edodes]